MWEVGFWRGDGLVRFSFRGIGLRVWGGCRDSQVRRGIAELSELSLQVFDPSGLMWDLG